MGGNPGTEGGAMNRSAPDGPAARRAHVWVSGRVQGVGFRWYTREEAMRRGLAGWVRNLPDGRVEAVFEGPPDRVASMLEWCRTGPRLAGVEGMEAVDERMAAEKGFRIF
jgi:acylphosphatase